MTKIKRWLLAIPIIFVLALIILVIVTGVRQNKTVQDQASKINVVSSLNFYGEMAQAVGGDRVTVTNVIDKASVDPHEFEPTAVVAKTYQKAQVIISNGGGYDPWSTNFAKANSQADSVTVAKLVGYHTGDNEHFWYSADTAKLLTEQLVKSFTKLDPQNKEQFEKNQQAYLKSLAPLNDLRESIRGQLAGKSVLTTEPVMDNTLEPLGAKIIVPEFATAVEEGTDPSSADIRAWHDAIDQGKVALVIKNKQTTSKLVDQAVAYAEEKQVPVIGVTETKPDNMSFLKWQEQQLEAIRGALAQ